MHELPKLPYAADALEPHLDSRPLDIHHDKHPAAYLTNLSYALAPHADLQQLSVEELLKSIERLPESIRAAVRNHGGGHANHTLFWESLAAHGGGAPSGDLA